MVVDMLKVCMLAIDLASCVLKLVNVVGNWLTRAVMTWTYDIKSTCLIGVKVREKLGSEMVRYALLNDISWKRYV